MNKMFVVFNFVDRAWTRENNEIKSTLKILSYTVLVSRCSGSVDTWKVLWRISLAIALRCLTKLRRRKKEEATVTVVTERQESLPEAAMRSSPSSSSDDSGEREEPVDSTGATATVERSQQEQEVGKSLRGI